MSKVIGKSNSLLLQAVGSVVLLVLGGTPARSQGLTPSTPSKEYIRINGQIVATENWIGLSSIGVGSDGTLWALTGAGAIYQYVPGQGWNLIPGNLSRLIIGSSTSVWGLNSGNYTYHYVNGSFQYVPGNLTQMAVGADGDTWGINSAYSIYHFNGSGWTQIPGSLVQISVGNASNVYGVNGAGSIYHYNTSTGSFQQFSTGTLANVSVDSYGDIWGINGSGTLYHWWVGGWWPLGGGPYSAVSVGSTYSNVFAISGTTVYQCASQQFPQGLCSISAYNYSFVGAATNTAFGISGNQIEQCCWSPLPEMMAWFREQLNRFRLFQFA